MNNCLKAAVIIIASFGFFVVEAGADEAIESDKNFFEETKIIRDVLPIDSFSILSVQEKYMLEAAKEVLTEFLRRINLGDNNQALDLLSDDLRGRYSDAEELYRNNFKSESIVSYRIVNFFLASDKRAANFNIVLRETIEGREFGRIREISLIRIADGWRIHSIK